MDADEYFQKAMQYIANENPHEAIKYFKKAIKLNPTNSAFYNNLGITEQSVGNLKDAIKHLLKVIQIDPNLYNAYFNLGGIYQLLDNHSEAIKYFEKCLEINPDFDLVYSSLYYSKRKICDWTSLKEISKKLDKLQPYFETPFISIVRSENLSKNKLTAEARSNEISNNVSKFKRTINFSYNSQRRKITVGYVSDSFRDFPTSQNLVGVFEKHSKKRFKVIVYGLKKPDNSSYSKRILQAVDKFVDLSELKSIDAAKKVNDDQVDILVDLKGHTKGNRMEIFALRPAKIQVNFLGFVGTTGSYFHDYMIVDKIVVPNKHKKYYTEKLVYLPDTYWPADSKLLEIKKSSHHNSSSQVVFSSFNRVYKIEDNIFNTWIRILNRVPGSILQLLSENKVVIKNITEYSKKHGLDPKRIIFLPTLPKLEHIKRIQNTSIALDTFKVGGHTTTIDTLVAGVPVITMLGNHFASRVCSSILYAVGLPELATKNIKEYENLAVDLANNPLKLKNVKTKLEKNIKIKPLFDTEKYTKNLEKAYVRMVTDYRSGKPCRMIIV